MYYKTKTKKMKKLVLMSALVIGSFGIKTADAQIGIHINLHLGSAPVYAPAVSQPVYDDFYYLPDVEAYYSVGENCYYYEDGDNWVSAAYLPGSYHNFDWRNARRFEIHAVRPYMQHNVYRQKFGGYVNRSDFYAKAYSTPGRFNNDQYRGRDHYDNRSGNNKHNDYNQGHNQNNYTQPGQGNYNRSGNNGQPSNYRDGQDRGNQHFAANKTGVVQDRQNTGRPNRF